MPPTLASNMKFEWMALPEESFETLTFEEVRVGRRFICLPCPGDNSGHGGFKRGSYLFTKTHDFVATSGGEIDLPYHKEFRHGRATRNSEGNISDFLFSTPVLLIL
jgi:hypothetical protein